MRQKLTELKGEMDESSITHGDINSQPPKRDRSSQQKICRTVELNSTINQLDIRDYFIQQQQNSHSSAAQMELLPTNHINLFLCLETNLKL